MFQYDSDFYRQSQKERMAEMRDEYQRAQRTREPGAQSRFKRFAYSARSRMRFNTRRAPVYRA